jgi:hypothetical protein
MLSTAVRSSGTVSKTDVLFSKSIFYFFHQNHEIKTSKPYPAKLPTNNAIKLNIIFFTHFLIVSKIPFSLCYTGDSPDPPTLNNLDSI